MAQSASVKPSRLKLRQCFRNSAVHLISLALLTLTLGLIAATFAHGSENTIDQKAATHNVESLHEELIRVMKQGPEMGLKGRYESLLPTVTEHFDVPLMARVALGRHWASLDREQRQAYVDRLGQLIAVRYAARLTEFKGQKFRILTTESTASDRIAVNSQLTTANKDQISLYYRLFLRNDRWLIYDVVSQGVGDLAMMRAEYNKVYAESGISGLLEMLDDRINQYLDEQARADP